MNFRGIKTTHTSDSKLDKQKSNVLSEIKKLGAEEERLNKIIADHQAKKIKVDEFDEIISEKEQTIKNLISEISGLKDEKKSLTEEVSRLEFLNSEKEKTEEKVNYLNSVVRVLQADVKEFQNGKELIIKQMEDKHNQAFSKMAKANLKKEDMVKSLTQIIKMLSEE